MLGCCVCYCQHEHVSHADDFYVSLCLSTAGPPLQEAEHWQRSVLNMAKIATALIHERSVALVGQILQA